MKRAAHFYDIEWPSNASEITNPHDLPISVYEECALFFSVPFFPFAWRIKYGDSHLHNE